MSAFDGTLYPLKVDLSNADEASKFVKYVNDLDIPIDVLVNNAGVFIPGQIHSEEEGALLKMMDANLFSAYHITRGIIPEMMKRKRGYIFNICSVASFMAYPTGGSYSISKFALYGFSKSLREEMKEYNIKVTSVLPGATYTSSWEGVELPEERFMKSEDIAEAVFSTYMLSDRTVIEDLVLRPQLGDI